MTTQSAYRMRCTKRYDNFPFAHRQHNHKGHCRFIHGHNWSFEFEFACTALDSNGFVVDFGNLKWIKEWLDQMFDHTLVLNEDDPALKYLYDGLAEPTGCPPEVKEMFPFADLRVVPNGGAEGLALFISKAIGFDLNIREASRVQLVRVTVYEDSKNSATILL